MKICMLAPENSPSWGGVGAYTFNLLKNIPIDEEIHVITIDRDIEDSYDKLLSDRFIIHKIVDISKKDTFFYNLKFQLAILKQFKKLYKEYGFDIIHSHSGHLPHLFSQFQRTAPMAVTVHATVSGMRNGINKFGFKESKTETLMKFFSLGIEQGEKIGFHKADLLLPVSDFTLKQININYGYNNPGKIKVMHNAVDTSLFSPKEKEKEKNMEEPTLLFVGRLYAIKGIDIFIDSLEILSKKGFKFKVLIVGRGETERVKERLLKILPPEKFEIKGRVTYFNMPEVYRNSDILVVSSVYENCPATILEAMSTKTLVVAPAVGGITEIVKDKFNGFLFETGNVIQLTEILKNIISKNVDINKICVNARSCILENFDWKKRGREIFDEYKKIDKNGKYD